MSDTCIVIPIYNHREAIGGTLARLVGHGLPILVVDDGSDAPTQQVLAESCAISSLRCSMALGFLRGFRRAPAISRMIVDA